MLRRATLGGVAAATHTPSHTCSTRPRRRSSFVLALAAVTTTLACAENGPVIPEINDGSTDPPPPAETLATAELTMVSGDNQEGAVATALGAPLVVEVTDSAGNPLKGVEVDWTFSQGRGRGLGHPSFAAHFGLVTDSLGRSAVLWELGTRSGEQVVSVEIVQPSSVAGLDDGGSQSAARRWRWFFRARSRAGAVHRVSVAPSHIDLVEGDSVDLAASVTDRWNNSIDNATVQWSSTNEAVARTDASGTVVAVGDGTATVMATVDTKEGSATVNAQSEPDPTAPTASILSPTGDRTIALGESVTFSGTATDSDGTIASHAWDFGDGTTASVASPAPHTYGAAGTYVATYAVVDNDGLSSPSVSRTITVTDAPGNSAPSASIVSPSGNVTIVEGESVTFSGNASDSDGSIDRHRWNFGDGSTSAAANPGAHTFSTAGTYFVTYRVWDDDGAASPLAQRTVTVESDDPPPPPPPPPGPSGELLIASDWSTATGTSLAATTDGGKWIDNGGEWTDGRTRVVTGSGGPAPNALQFTHNTGDYLNTWLMAYMELDAMPQIGERITWRWYMNHKTSDLGYNSDHGIAWTGQQRINGDEPWFTQDSPTATDFRAGLQLGESQPSPNSFYTNGRVPKNEWHRYEMQFEQLTANSWEVRLRIWDTDDATILFDSQDFRASDGAGTLADATMTGDARRKFQTFVGFVGGFDQAAQSTQVLSQWAAVAAVRGDHVGPYDPARGW